MWKHERRRRALNIGLILQRCLSLSDLLKTEITDLLKTEIKKGFALFLASKTDKMFDRQIHFSSLNF